MDVEKLYPLAENAPDLIKSPTGKSLSDLTVEGVVNGDVTISDLAISPEALHMQAEIASAAGRSTLADNFHRAAELVNVPQEVLMETYEMLRPGRSDWQSLRDRAEHLRQKYGADLIAAFLEEAADAYKRRGLFTKRF